MRRLLFFSALLLLAFVHRGSGAPTQARQQKAQAVLDPYHSLSVDVDFKGGERACVIVSGFGKSYMGLYVLDAHQNCVAWDDLGNKSTRKNLAVEWYPPDTGTYTIQVRNFGEYPCGVVMVIR